MPSLSGIEDSQWEANMISVEAVVDKSEITRERH
jgi:hypothetical protein